MRVGIDGMRRNICFSGLSHQVAVKKKFVMCVGSVQIWYIYKLIGVMCEAETLGRIGGYIRGCAVVHSRKVTGKLVQRYLWRGLSAHIWLDSSDGNHISYRACFERALYLGPIMHQGDQDIWFVWWCQQDTVIPIQSIDRYNYPSDGHNEIRDTATDMFHIALSSASEVSAFGCALTGRQ